MPTTSLDPLQQLAPPARTDALRADGRAGREEQRFGKELARAAVPAERPQESARGETSSRRSPDDDPARSKRPAERDSAPDDQRRTTVKPGEEAPAPAAHDMNQSTETVDSGPDDGAPDAATEPNDAATLLAAEANAATAVVSPVVVAEPSELIDAAPAASATAVGDGAPPEPETPSAAAQQSDPASSTAADAPDPVTALQTAPEADAAGISSAEPTATPIVQDGPAAAAVADPDPAPAESVAVEVVPNEAKASEPTNTTQSESTASDAGASAIVADSAVPETTAESDQSAESRAAHPVVEAVVAAEPEGEPQTAPVEARRDQAKDKTEGDAPTDQRADAPADVPADVAAPAPTADATAPDPSKATPAPAAPVAAADQRGPSSLERLGTPHATHLAGPDRPAGDTTGVDRARFLQRVAGAFRTAEGRDGHVRVRLSPPELGSLRIELTVQQGIMHAQLETETPAARQALLDNLPALRERLAEQNIRVERFDVDVRRDGNGQQQAPDGQSPWGDAGERQARRDGQQEEPSRAATKPNSASRPRGTAPAATEGLDVRV